MPEIGRDVLARADEEAEREGKVRDGQVDCRCDPNQSRDAAPYGVVEPSDKKKRNDEGIALESVLVGSLVAVEVRLAWVVHCRVLDLIKFSGLSHLTCKINQQDDGRNKGEKHLEGYFFSEDFLFSCF